MTASKYIKAQGLPSTAYVADKVGKPPQTINNWFNHNYALFQAVVDGIEYQQLMEEMEGKDWRESIRRFYERERE